MRNVDMQVLGEWVGLRPCRRSVRLEHEELCLEVEHGHKAIPVIHNYGEDICHCSCACDIACTLLQVVEGMPAIVMSAGYIQPCAQHYIQNDWLHHSHSHHLVEGSSNLQVMVGQGLLYIGAALLEPCACSKTSCDKKSTNNLRWCKQFATGSTMKQPTSAVLGSLW